MIQLRKMFSLRSFKKLLVPVLLLVVVSTLIIPMPANAQGGDVAPARDATDFVKKDVVACQNWILPCFFNDLASFIARSLLKLSSWVLWASGILLNATITWTIIKFPDIVSAMTSINEAWVVVRDLANMSFIFLLLYVAVKLILGMGGSTKEFIRNLILAALFINFSMFIVNVVIDASNIVTTNFYCSISNCGDNGSGISGAINYADNGLSNQVVSYIKLPSVYSGGNFKDVGSEFTNAPGQTTPLEDSSALLLVGVMGSAVMIISAIVFFAVSGMLIKRFVVLIFLLVFSPLAFLGLVLPKVPSGKFWDRLWHEAVYAPVFFVVMWVAFKILRTANILQILTNSPSNSTWGTAMVSGLSTQMIPLVMNFIIVIGFIIFALVAAQSLGGTSSKFINKWMGRAVFGAVGVAGRQTIGRAANALSQTEWFGRRAAGTFVGRSVAGGIRSVASSSFDARNARAVKGAVGAVGNYANVDLGEAKGDGGYADYANKAKEKTLKNIQAGGGASKETAAKISANEDKVYKARLDLEEKIKGGNAVQIAAARASLRSAEKDLGKSLKQKTRDIKDQQAARSRRLQKWAWIYPTTRGAQLAAASEYYEKAKPSKDDEFNDRISAVQDQLKAPGAAGLTDVHIDAVLSSVQQPKERKALIKGLTKVGVGGEDLPYLEAVAGKLKKADIAAISRDDEFSTEQKKVIADKVRAGNDQEAKDYLLANSQYWPA